MDFTIDEPGLKALIVKKLGGANEHLQKIISERISLAYNILDFLEQTGR